MIRAMIAAGAVIMGLSGCAESPAPEADQTTVAVITPETASEPSAEFVAPPNGPPPTERSDERPDRVIKSIISSDDRVDISITFPDTPLPAKLADELEAYAKNASETAQAIAAEDEAYSKAEGYDFYGHSLYIDYAIAGTPTDRFLSLVGSISIFSGGAHPNQEFDVVNWDRSAERRFTFSDMISPTDAALKAVADRVNLELQEAKVERLEGYDVDDEEISESIAAATEPVIENFETFVLHSDSGQGNTGLRFLYAPYEIGAYAEGSYQAIVPAGVFKEFLTEPFATVFD